MSLSSGLTLTDLSDYLAPSQACIKPVTYVAEESDSSALDKPSASAAAEIIIGEDSGFYEKGQDGEKGKKLKKAEITLNDCLACSGCITSAESVLVSMQSHEEVYRVLRKQPDLTPILSVSPQSVASLAALYDLSLEETMRGLRAFFKQHLGFRLIFDTTFPRALSLLESRSELHERRSNYYANPSPSLPSLLTASTSSLAAPTKLSPASSSIAPLPILSSACPGWICYAEKTHGDLLPFVSGVKSPQAVSGVLVKGAVVAGRLGLRPDQVYHVAVMPCYDKKLEASRPDFATTHQVPTFADGTESVSVRDVDLVLTTGEVARMISDKGLSLRVLAATGEASDFDGRTEEQFFPFSQLLNPPRGTSSGSYVHAALSSLLSPPSTSNSPTISSSPTISRSDWPFLRLESKLVRNDDYVEYTLRRVSTPYASSSSSDTTTEPGEVLVKAAKCYGFRNLQNVVRKLSREAGVSVGRGAAGKAPASSAAAAANARRAAKLAGGAGAKDAKVEPLIEFIEVMACPSGCVNGGGQAAPPRESLRARKRRASWTGAAGEGFVGRVDEEGMPDTVGEVVEAEIKIVANQDVGKGAAGEGTGVGSDDDRVLSAKEWVQEVEKRYWSGSATADRPRRDNLHIDSIHPSIRPFVLALPSAEEEEALAGVLEEMLGSDDGASRDARRKALLRTSYRAVESEEVNGLAVTW
ncbi:Cytosolic Fe-S cluster assembly factor nar1 [Rhodotorula toruloides]